MLHLWQLFVEWVFTRARDSAAVHVQTALLLSYADCGLHEQANELRRQLQALTPANVSSLLAEPSANGTAQLALPEPTRRPGRPPKTPTPERSDP